MKKVWEDDDGTFFLSSLILFYSKPFFVGIRGEDEKKKAVYYGDIMRKKKTYL